MENIQNKTINYAPKILPKNVFESMPKRAKITGTLSVICTVLATAFLIVGWLLPIFSGWTVLLYFEFLLLTAFFSSFGFLEINSMGSKWLNTITSAVSVILLLLLFVLSLGKLDSLQLWGFYSAFSILVPILLAITAFSSNKFKKGKAFIPLIVPMFSAAAWILSATKSPLALALLPVGWAVVGLAAFVGNDEGK